MFLCSKLIPNLNGEECLFIKIELTMISLIRPKSKFLTFNSICKNCASNSDPKILVEVNLEKEPSLRESFFNFNI